jgi:hypothetical protein
VAVESAMSGYEKIKYNISSNLVLRQNFPLVFVHRKGQMQLWTKQINQGVVDSLNEHSPGIGVSFFSPSLFPDRLPNMFGVVADNRLET